MAWPAGIGKILRERQIDTVDAVRRLGHEPRRKPRHVIATETVKAGSHASLARHRHVIELHVIELRVLELRERQGRVPNTEFASPGLTASIKSSSRRRRLGQQTSPWSPLPQHPAWTQTLAAERPGCAAPLTMLMTFWKLVIGAFDT